MQQQKKRATHAKPKINVKRMTLYARVVLFVLILSGVIVTGVLAITTGVISPSTVATGLLTLIVGVATVLTLFPPRLEATISITNPSPSPSANVIQNTGAKIRHPIFFPALPLSDPNEFYGYDVARRTLITRIFGGGSSSIVGEHGSCKTWLLEYLQLVVPVHSEFGQAYRIGYVSAMHHDCETQAGFVRLALEALNVQSPDPSSRPLSQFSRTIRDLKQLGVRSVL
jgi:hypothetical protein